MDFSYVSDFEEGIIVHGVRNFEPKHIFECGQCFRWENQDDGSYLGIAWGKVLKVEKKDEELFIYNISEAEFRDIWADYFDLYRDYGTMKEILSRDPILRDSVEYGYGIRILNQEPFEMLISFITSANNMIPRIKKSINKISEKWGTKILYKEKEYHAFPSLQQLREATVEELTECGLGFRAKYVKAALESLCSCNQDMEWISCQEPGICHAELQKFAGVGPKVADCIMLFSMGKYSAFPVDVWVKRAMQHFYQIPDASLKRIREFGIEKFGELSGFAQQYLFYYTREKNIKI
jgi:N-glycosylase/DNA lyase